MQSMLPYSYDSEVVAKVVIKKAPDTKVIKKLQGYEVN
jgi:hypothetical protein